MSGLIDTMLAMDPWLIAAFVGASIILYLTPGADMMFAIASGMSGGPRAGFAAALGISAGVLGHVLIAVLGLAALLAAHPAAYDAIRYLGAAYLLFLAWSAWRAPVGVDQAMGGATMRRAFWRGCLTNLLNPKVALFILALLPQFAEPAIGALNHQIIILGAIFVLGTIIFKSIYGVAAGLIADRLRRASRLMNRLSALVFGGLAARLVID